MNLVGTRQQDNKGVIMTIEERLAELAIEMKDAMLVQLTSEAEVVLDSETRDRIMDCNNRGTSKLITDMVLASVRTSMTPLLSGLAPTYLSDDKSARLDMLNTRFKYRFFIDDKEVFTTGATYSYRGDYDVLAIEYSEDKSGFSELTKEDLPIENGEMFESWKSGLVPIGKTSNFTLAKSESYSQEITFKEVVYDRKNKESRYYFTSKV